MLCDGGAPRDTIYHQKPNLPPAFTNSTSKKKHTHVLYDGGAPRGQVGQHAVVVHHVEERDAPEVDAEVGADAHRPVLAPEHLQVRRSTIIRGRFVCAREAGRRAC